VLLFDVVYGCLWMHGELDAADEGHWMAGREVKCANPSWTDGGEGYALGRMWTRRTKAGGSKSIRYRFSFSSELCRLPGVFCMHWGVETWSVWVVGRVCSQGGNLKRLTEGHHQEWSVRLNLTQRGATYRCRRTFVRLVLRCSGVVHGRLKWMA